MGTSARCSGSVGIPPPRAAAPGRPLPLPACVRHPWCSRLRGAAVRPGPCCSSRGACDPQAGCCRAVGPARCGRGAGQPSWRPPLGAGASHAPRLGAAAGMAPGSKVQGWAWRQGQQPEPSRPVPPRHACPSSFPASSPHAFLPPGLGAAAGQHRSPGSRPLLRRASFGAGGASWGKAAGCGAAAGSCTPPGSCGPAHRGR